MLTDMERKIINLRYYKGYTIRDIAKELKRSASTVHYHLKRINGIIDIVKQLINTGSNTHD